jgi:hypothetical protein
MWPNACGHHLSREISPSIIGASRLVQPSILLQQIKRGAAGIQGVTAAEDCIITGLKSFTT